MIVDHHRRCVQRPDQFRREIQAAREAGCLERVRQSIRLPDRFIKIIIAVDRDHRAEDLFAGQSNVRRRVNDDGWRIRGLPDLFAAAQQLSAAVRRLGHPVRNAGDFARPN
jgi:hypothetical protein